MRFQTARLPELPAVINFGPGNAQKDFAKLKQLRPDGPMMTGEYWDGWFDHWGAPHTADTPDQQAKDLDWMLRQGYSVSLYMFHGGTSFGWMNGANSDGKTYEPDVTSYDYNSPLDESGHPTPKYYRFRDIIAKDTGIKPPPVPAAPATMTLPAISLAEGVSLWKSLPAAIHSERPLSMEAFGQAYGYILYRTQLDGPVDSVIDLRYGARLRADLCGWQIGGDARSSAGTTSAAVACLFRSCAAGCSGGEYGASEFWPVAARGASGACGAGQAGAKSADRVGCLSAADVEAGRRLAYSKTPCSGACFYRASFTVTTPKDTFLDTSALTKGEVWLNGRALGRFWNVGPQKTLYIPAPWLKPGKNEVVVFDLDGKPDRKIEGLDHPILHATVAANPVK